MKITPQHISACPLEMSHSKTADPFLMVIFGGGGDLSCKQLIPSIFRLFEGEKIKQFSAIGIGRTPLTDAQYRDKLKSCLKHKLKSKFNEKRWKKFSENIFYQASDVSKPALYKELCMRIAAFKKQHKKNYGRYYGCLRQRKCFRKFRILSKKQRNGNTCLVHNDQPCSFNF